MIADEFTFLNVKIVAQAIADYIISEGLQDRGVIVGYDTRFLGDRFAEASALVMAGNGMKAFLTDRDSPTPSIAYEIVSRKAAGGINITASHNPFYYSGIKFSPDWGGPALPRTTEKIEYRANELRQKKELFYLESYLKQKFPFKGDLPRELSKEEALDKGLLEYIDPREKYLERIGSLIDKDAIRRAKLKVVVDVMYGTGRNYLDAILEDLGCEVKVLNNSLDPFLGGVPPEPAEENVPDLIELVRNSEAVLGLGTDGDADRFGIVDSDGRYIDPNYVISLLLRHLVRNRGWKGEVVRTVVTTHLIDELAERYGIEVVETKVGFKYIGQYMVEHPDTFIMGGEESGGLTIRGHVPEKDGILACLLVAELVALEGKTLSQILQDIYDEVGVTICDRMNLRVSEERKEGLFEELRDNPPQTLAGRKVKEVVTLDGYKFILDDGGWLAIRPSGTEPVIRCYLEAKSAEEMERLASEGKVLITGEEY